MCIRSVSQSDADPEPASDLDLSSQIVTGGPTVDLSEDEDSNSGANGVEQTAETTPKSTRKRKTLRKPENWARNKRIKLRESGKAYKDTKGIEHQARVSNGTCLKGCKLACQRLIIEQERQKIFESFWRLSDEKKLHFYAKFVDSNTPGKRAKTNKRSKTYTYFFELDDNRIHVCREFFLTVLNISKQRIYHFFKNNINPLTKVAKSPMKGKHRKNFIDPVVLDKVRSHIKSFPTVEPHYCRANTQKQYLDQRLDVTKMYALYLESDFVVNNIPVKLHKYRSVFNTEFNLSFFVPKKDRCDTCVAFELLSNPSDEEVAAYNDHKAKKLLGKVERDSDRSKYVRGDTESCELCFDLENTFSLPKAEVSNFFYKRKLNVYNLTAHCSSSGVTYCALWNETQSGRSGNDIASAIVKILNAVCTDNPLMQRLILWSDSCVPQNRNSIMSTALLKFLENSQVQVIEQKYSEAGHGLIQEIDAIHSKIERSLKRSEIFSPISLLRLLTTIPANTAPLKFMQMKASDFLNFQVAAKGLSFNQIPYTKVKHLSYNRQEPMHVRYRCSFEENDNLISVRLNRPKMNRQTKKSPVAGTSAVKFLPNINVLKNKPVLPADKVKDLRSMLRYMPQIDVEFYNAILK